MKKCFILLVLTTLLATPSARGQQLTKEQTKILEKLDARTDEFGKIAKEIWNLAELGYQEHKSSKILLEKLQTGRIYNPNGCS